MCESRAVVREGPSEKGKVWGEGRERGRDAREKKVCKGKGKWKDCLGSGRPVREG